MQVIHNKSKRWTTADLEALDYDEWLRYEIINGELFVTRAPHWKHQKTCTNLVFALKSWSNTSGLGEVVTTPGIIFSDADNVIPDVVWASTETLENYLDEKGHLVSAPELIIEVLSEGKSNEKRDNKIKLDLYSERGVREYWICDWRNRTITIYRQEENSLKPVKTLSEKDTLTSPLLPSFSANVSDLLAR
jgi:Uma2 family endonuclease